MHASDARRRVRAARWHFTRKRNVTIHSSAAISNTHSHAKYARSHDSLNYKYYSFFFFLLTPSSQDAQFEIKAAPLALQPADLLNNHRFALVFVS